MPILFDAKGRRPGPARPGRDDDGGGNALIPGDERSPGSPASAALTPVNDYTKVNSTIAGAQFAPAITALSGGGYIIVWEDSSAGAIYAQRFSATGQPVGSELHLDGTQGGSALWVSVAATANDGFVIAFQAGGFAQAEIFGRRYDGLNNPVGGLFAVNTTSPNEQFNPHIATLDNGGLLFTWDTRFTSGNDVVDQEVRGRIYLPDGQALGNDFAIAPLSATDKHGLSAISSLPGGGFVVTWQRAKDNSDNFEIVGQRYTSSGAKVGAEFQANTQTANNQYGNDVARLSGGGFVVTWIDPVPNEGGGRVVARHYDASGDAIGGEILIDSKASGAYGRTVVTALANGGYVVSWTDGENNVNIAHNVSARAFGANDAALDLAFDISFDSPFGANFFSDGAVTLANGNVVFAWDGPSVGTGSGQDIYTRQYSVTAAPGPIDGTTGPDALSGTSGDDTINGMDGNDLLSGLGGTDTLNGGGGNDRLGGGAGADVMNGGTGDDTFFVDNAGDQIGELVGEGSDVVAASVDYVLTPGASVELMTTGGAGGTAPINLTGNELANQIWGNAAGNMLSGGGGNDVLLGFGGADTLSGGEGNDMLFGGAGAADTLVGGLGDDLYFIDDAGDIVVEASGEGRDIVASNLDYALGPGASIELMTTGFIGGTATLNLTGNELGNELWGNDGVNALHGGGGNATDALFGFGGNDRLDGGGGLDLLVGGAGQDSFVFADTLNSAEADIIADFSSADDMILLDDAVFAGLALGALNPAAFVTGPAALDANDRIIYDATNGRLYFDADGSGTRAAIQFATLSGNPALNAGDFTII
ncbi:MAG TPA: calcium-binding protein [Allosphingosinicella sp.]|nr:calcium-binding protein [Allosphingosinicella sp.]